MQISAVLIHNWRLNAGIAKENVLGGGDKLAVIDMYLLNVFTSVFFVSSLISLQFPVCRGTKTLVIEINSCESKEKSWLGTGRFRVPRNLVRSKDKTTSLSHELILQFSAANSQPCEYNEILAITIGLDYAADGNVYFNPVGALGVFSINHTTWYKPNEICGLATFIGNETAHFQIGLCKSKSTQETLVLNKCCPSGEILDLRTSQYLSCQPLGVRKWTPTFYDEASFKDSRTCAHKSTQVIKHRFLPVELDDFIGGIQLFKYPFSFFELNKTQPGTWFYLLEDGRIRSRKEDSGGRLDVYDDWETTDLGGTKYCIDGLVNSHHDPGYEDMISEIVMFRPDYEILDRVESNETVAVHYIEMDNGTQTRYPPQRVVYLCASSFALLIWLFILLTHLHRMSSCSTKETNGATTVRALTMFTQAISALSLTAFSTASAYLNSALSVDERRGSFCTVAGIGKHYFLLSFHLWVVFGSCELCRSLRCLSNEEVSRLRELTLYLTYFFLGFGIPALIVGYCVYTDYAYGDYSWYFSDCPVLVPRYGQDWCFVSIRTEGVFVFLPLCALLILNLILCFYALFFMHFKSGNSELDGVRSQESSGLIVLSKVFVIIGVFLTLDFVAYMAEPDVRTPKDMHPLLFGVVMLSMVGRPCILLIIQVTKHCCHK